MYDQGAPARHGRAAVAMSVPQIQGRVYRPGTGLALLACAGPVIVALAAALIGLNATGHVPLWLPLILLLWLPCMPLLALGLRSVQINGNGISTGTPWGRWRDMRWDEVERATTRFGIVRLHGAPAGPLTFMPFMLHDGLRLERQLVLRIPPTVMQGRLRRHALQLTAGNTFPTTGVETMAYLRTHVRIRWQGLAALLGFVLLAGGSWLIATHVSIAAILTGIALAIAAALLVCTACWLRQDIRLDDGGVRTRSFPLKRTRSIAWDEVELVELMLGDLMLRLRGDRRLLLPGPGLLHRRPAQAMRAWLQQQSTGRSLLVLSRGPRAGRRG